MNNIIFEKEPYASSSWYSGIYEDPHDNVICDFSIVIDRDENSDSYEISLINFADMSPENLEKAEKEITEAWEQQNN